MAITITGNPGVPSLSDPANFNNDALAFLTWLTKNTSGGFIYQLENLDAADFFSVLGTVSQSGGTPTGAIIERDSNANGEYVRFADGTQICAATISSAVDATTLVGSIYQTTAVSTWTFPAVFASTTGLSVAGSPRFNDAWLVARTASASSANYRMFSPVSTSTLRSVELIAIGRWF